MELEAFFFYQISLAQIDFRQGRNEKLVENSNQIKKVNKKRFCYQFDFIPQTCSADLCGFSCPPCVRLTIFYKPRADNLGQCKAKNVE